MLNPPDVADRADDPLGYFEWLAMVPADGLNVMQSTSSHVRDDSQP